MSFEAMFHFDDTDILLHDENGGVLVFLSPGRGPWPISLEEAIPQLERVLEIAKMIVNKEAQEAADGE